MPHGPGKYDYIATGIRKQIQAKGVALIVLGGESGNGFSVQMPLPTLLQLPDMLEQMAQQIRADMKG